jgi:hypothetical protein
MHTFPQPPQFLQSQATFTHSPEQQFVVGPASLAQSLSDRQVVWQPHIPLRL